MRESVPQVEGVREMDEVAETLRVRETLEVGVGQVEGEAVVRAVLEREALLQWLPLLLRLVREEAVREGEGLALAQALEVREERAEKV